MKRWFLFGGLSILLLLAVASADTFLSLTDTPSAYTTAGKVVIINASGDGLTFSNEPMPWVYHSYTDQIKKNLDVNIFGDLQIIDQGDTLNSVTPITDSKGTGKLVIAPIAGTDTSGTITVTGTYVDRDTQEKTQGYTENITVTDVCQDNSFVNGGGTLVQVLEGCYITDVWYTGEINLTTTDLDLSNVDLYHISFDQGNDKKFVISSADINYYVSNANGELYAYFYYVDVTKASKTLDLYPIANYTEDNHVDNSYYRGRGKLNFSVDGTEDGFFVQFNFLPNAQQYFEQVDFKVWGEYIE